jgi:DNA polymerase (family 10)
MPVHNADVARLFREVADLLEIDGANEFRVRAYRNAAQTVEQLARPVAEMVDADEDLTELSGVGDDLAEKMATIVETGSLPLLEELEERLPSALTDLLRIEGLGPKRVRALFEELDITNREELRDAARAGRIQQIDGFGETLQQNILDHLDEAVDEEARTLWMRAEPVADALADYLAHHDDVQRAVVAGSFRRKKETVGDLDVLAQAPDDESVRDAIMDHFVAYEDAADVRSRGTTRSALVLRSGLQVDLRIVSDESFGAALHYFTGSKAHNIAIRNRALDHGHTVNEYGVFEQEEKETSPDSTSGPPVAGKTEEDVYDAVGLPYILPELRENRGEIEAADAGDLPDLIEEADLRGNLHTHTTDSDGQASLEDMAAAAEERELDYLAITDHSPLVGIVKGLDAERLREQVDRIRALDEEMSALTLLSGIEVDIREDGTLDLPDDVLAELDVVVASVHTALDLDADSQTDRMLRGMDNENVHVIAHPTGRRLGERPPIGVDVHRLIEGAADRGCALELNAQPQRLDLDDRACKAAKEAGVPIVLSADAHDPEGLGHLRFGIAQARRGWLEAGDVVNTRPWDEAQAILARD